MSIWRLWLISTRCAGASCSTVIGRSSPRGNLFRREWFAIEDDWPREVTGIVRAWDDAATRDGGDWSVGVLMAMARSGIVYIIDVVRIQGSPLEVERLKVGNRPRRCAAHQPARGHSAAAGARRLRQILR